MGAIKIETPATLKGTPEQQLLQLYSYLFRMSENLNIALNNLNRDNFSSAYQLSSGQQTDIDDMMTDDKWAEYDKSYNELRSLIINTASVIRSEMDKISTELNSNYTAISEEWGTFQKNISSTIEATAEGIAQNYKYDEEIKTLQEDVAGFSEYRMSTEGYIRQGFIDYDESNIPIIGIAIGQGLTSTEVTAVNGEVYQKIDNNQSCAFYTADRVSFRINGQEVAYISNRKLYIRDVEITGSVILGGEWMISTTNGLKIQWIGEVQ